MWRVALAESKYSGVDEKNVFSFGRYEKGGKVGEDVFIHALKKLYPRIRKEIDAHINGLREKELEKEQHESSSNK